MSIKLLEFISGCRCAFFGIECLSAPETYNIYVILVYNSQLRRKLSYMIGKKVSFVVSPNRYVIPARQEMRFDIGREYFAVVVIASKTTPWLVVGWGDVEQHGKYVLAQFFAFIHKEEIVGIEE